MFVYIRIVKALKLLKTNLPSEKDFLKKLILSVSNYRYLVICSTLDMKIIGEDIGELNIHTKLILESS